MNPKANLFGGQKKWNTRNFMIDENIHFTRPKFVGYYSVNESQELVEDLSELKYMLKQPGSTYLDLTYGIEHAKAKEVYTKHNPFFEYLSRHEDIVNKFESSALKNVGFITSRGVLIAIGKMPWVYNEDEIFIAHLVNGVIYLNQQMKSNNETYETGFKFRQHLLSSSTKLEPNSDGPVNSNSEFNGVFSFKLGNDNILSLSEVDGVSANSMESRNDICKDLDERSNIVELNSQKLVKLFSSLKTDDDPKFAQHKSLTYWLKCLYSKNEEIYIGFKNREEIVYEIKKYSLEDMENIGKKYWSSNAVLSFTSEFLTFVKNCFMDKISDDCDIKSLPHMKLCFKYEARSRKGIVAFSNVEVIDSLEDGEYTWLPEWYINKKTNKND